MVGCGSGLYWVWGVVGCDAVDQCDRFAFVEVCCGGLNPGWRVAVVGLCVCVCVLLGGLIGNGGLGCGFALCVFLAW